MLGTNLLLASITRMDVLGWDPLITYPAVAGLHVQTIRALPHSFIEMLHAKGTSPTAWAAVRMVRTDLLAPVGTIFFGNSLVIDIGYFIAYVDVL
jgi:hypothetical protein